MGNRRMFSLSVVDTDKFIDMPVSARLLYYELAMRADDDGFVSSCKKIMRMVGCSEDDFKLLIAKNYLIYFESGIIVITHWKMHNYIPKDRYRKTIFQEEYGKLQKENDVYTLSDTLCIQDVYNTDTECIQVDNNLYTQDKLSKDKLSKDKLSKDNIRDMSTCVDAQIHLDCQAVVKLFNSICTSLPSVQKLTDKRKKQILKAEKLLSESSFAITFEQLFRIIESSDFLTGRSGGWNGCGFDWILNPSNLTKIIEGNYKNKVTVSTPTTRDYEEEF